MNSGINLPKLTPWKSWDEWIQVKEALFERYADEAWCTQSSYEYSGGGGAGKKEEGREGSDAPNPTYWGLEAVTCWKSRGKIPHSVEATAQLIEVRLNDPVLTPPMAPHLRRSELECRLQYSMVVVRTINGLVDTSQQGVFADSVASIASRIGLPTWLVELRHDSTHNQLPAISVLQAASQQLLMWLWGNYWHRQHAYIAHLRLMCCCLCDPAFRVVSDNNSNAGESSSNSSSSSNNKANKVKDNQPCSGRFGAALENLTQATLTNGSSGSGSGGGGDYDNAPEDDNNSYYGPNSGAAGGKAGGQKMSTSASSSSSAAAATKSSSNKPRNVAMAEAAALKDLRRQLAQLNILSVTFFTDIFIPILLKFCCIGSSKSASSGSSEAEPPWAVLLKLTCAPRGNKQPQGNHAHIHNLIMMQLWSLAVHTVDKVVAAAASDGPSAPRKLEAQQTKLENICLVARQVRSCLSGSGESERGGDCSADAEVNGNQSGSKALPLRLEWASDIYETFLKLRTKLTAGAASDVADKLLGGLNSLASSILSGHKFDLSPDNLEGTEEGDSAEPASKRARLNDKSAAAASMHAVAVTMDRLLPMGSSSLIFRLGATTASGSRSEGALSNCLTSVPSAMQPNALLHVEQIDSQDVWCPFAEDL